MNEDGLAQFQAGLFVHFPNAGLDGALAIVNRARHEVVAVRILPGRQYTRAKFIAQHHLVALRIVAQHGDGIASLHDLA
ncbi:MAG: hypothetical protein WDM77_09975 [Steroidobacteraceae bacterium]